MKKILITTCTSFTACVLLFSAFSNLLFMIPLSSAVIFQLFIMTVSISAVMHLFEILSDKYDLSLLVDGIARIFICYLIVGIEGIAFGMLPFKWLSLVYISIVIVPTFVITYVLVYFTSTKYAHDINERIKKRERKNENDECR